MIKNLLLILLMLGGIILNGTEPVKVNDAPPTEEVVTPTEEVVTPTKKMAPPTKRVLEAKIRSLANGPIPTKLVSMVSEPIDPLPDKIIYNCPICKKDTVHIRPSVVYRHSMWPVSLLGYMKKDLAEVVKKSVLPISFDERAFCKFCSDEKDKDKDKDTVFIEIEVDGEIVRNKYQNNDLRILNAFFSNRNDVDIQRGSGFRAYPLKDYIPRIQELLGL